MRPIEIIQRGLAISIVALWVGAFAAAGWDSIIPYPVDFQTGMADTALFDMGAGTTSVRIWLHEYVGLVAYWLAGRSTVLFP